MESREVKKKAEKFSASSMTNRKQQSNLKAEWESEQKEERKKALKDYYDWMTRILSGQKVFHSETKAFQREYLACYEIWKGMEQMRGRYEKAQMIQMAFYQSGKLRWQMESFEEFVDEDLSNIEETKNIILQGYHVYVDLIRLDYIELKQRCRAYVETQKECVEEERRLRFLMDMASKNEYFEALATVYEKSYRIFEENRQQGMDYQELLSKNKELQAAMKGGNFKFDEMKISLKKRRRKMENEIQKSRELSKAMQEVLIEEKIKALCDQDIAREELIGRYRIFAREIQVKILDCFPREK